MREGEKDWLMRKLRRERWNKQREREEKGKYCGTAGDGLSENARSWVPVPSPGSFGRLLKYKLTSLATESKDNRAKNARV